MTLFVTDEQEEQQQQEQELGILGVRFQINVSKNGCCSFGKLLVVDTNPPPARFQG